MRLEHLFDHWKSIENIDLKSLKKQNLLLIHSKEINHPFESSLSKRVLKALEKADYVIANSKFTKECNNVRSKES